MSIWTGLSARPFPVIFYVELMKHSSIRWDSRHASNVNYPAKSFNVLQQAFNKMMLGIEPRIPRSFNGSKSVNTLGFSSPVSLLLFWPTLERQTPLYDTHKDSAVRTFCAPTTPPHTVHFLTGCCRRGQSQNSRYFLPLVLVVVRERDQPPTTISNTLSSANT